MYSPINGYLSCVHFLAIVNKAAVTVLSLLLVLLYVDLQWNCWTPIPFSMVAAPFHHIPTSNTPGFQFLYLLTSTDSCHPAGYVHLFSSGPRPICPAILIVN